MPIAPMLLADWALGAGLLGYDGAQWFWTGVSAVLGTIALIAASFRRKRVAAETARMDLANRPEPK